MANVVDQSKEQMKKSVESTKENFAGIRTRRANPAMINGNVVEYYGAPTPLKHVATIGVPEPRTLSVTPFDPSQANAVEKALRDSDLGASPRRNGSAILLTMPELTEDRRKEYVKLAKSKAEDGKVAVRNIRRKSKEAIDKAVKEAEMYAEEDKKRKEAVDVKNSLDQLLFSIESFIRESGDKLEPADKEKLEAEVKAGRDVLEKGDIEEIKKETERIAKSNAEIFQKFYQQNANAAQNGGDAGQNDGGDSDSGNPDFDIKDAE